MVLSAKTHLLIRRPPLVAQQKHYLLYLSIIRLLYI
jgi:hypothetical protein